MSDPGPPPAQATGWRYPDTGATRDLRIDFMRGFVFVMLFTSHFPGFSWMALVGWERFGVVSSAETFSPTFTNGAALGSGRL